MVRTVLDGGWTRDKSGTDGTAVNYWWGMNSGVMDVLLSRELPHDVRHLANILRSGIIAGSIDPFACYITAQNGTVMNEGRTGFTPEQILHMDWLCDAVEGHLPEFDELMDCARPMYRMQASTVTGSLQRKRPIYENSGSGRRREQVPVGIL